MGHRFDSGLAVPQRAAIRQAIMDGLEELRRPTLPGGGTLYLEGIFELAVPVRFTQDADEEHFRVTLAGRSPAVAVALGDRSFSSKGTDDDEWGGTLEVHVYTVSRNARGVMPRVAGDATSEASLAADPGIETITEHIFERLSGAVMRGARAAELRPVREGFVLFAEDAIVFEQVFEVDALTEVNKNRDLIVRLTSIDTSHTDASAPLPPGGDDPTTGPPPRTVTEIEES